MLAVVPVSPRCDESFCDLTEHQLGVRVLLQALGRLEIKCCPGAVSLGEGLKTVRAQ